MSTDIAIQVTSRTSANVGVQKPNFLVVMDLKGKNNFLTIEQPEFNSSYIKVKGVFLSLDVKEVSESYQNLVANIVKSDILEVIIPLNKIVYVQNLVFKAK